MLSRGIIAIIILVTSAINNSYANDLDVQFSGFASLTLSYTDDADIGFASNYLNENGIKSNGPRIRKIINYLRIQGYVPGLCATGSGYYIAANKEEYIEYIASFSKRVSSMLVVLDAAKRDLGELYNVVYSIPHLPTTQDLINMSVD